MNMKFTKQLPVIITATLLAPSAASAYPIDCAILLCLAGGFPASAECTAAKAEVIRRITPWPVEPPLQLWNCPMQAPAGIAVPSLGSDGLTPETRQYRDAIEIYHIQYSHRKTHDDVHVDDGSKIGAYAADGSFSWQATSVNDVPDWVYDATGVDPQRISRKTGMMFWRGVLMRSRDFRGVATTEWVPY